jgi:hypothetical protein
MVLNRVLVDILNQICNNPLPVKGSAFIVKQFTASCCKSSGYVREETFRLNMKKEAHSTASSIIDIKKFIPENDAGLFRDGLFPAVSQVFALRLLRQMYRDQILRQLLHRRETYNPVEE